VTLYFVRHGVAEGADGRCVGHCDLALSTAGERAIERLAGSWPEPSPHVYASDLARTSASAHALARRWGREVHEDARLREMNFGAWDGRPWAELERDDGERFAAWTGDWVRVPAPGGESFSDVIARMAAWFDEVRAAIETRGEPAVVVAHAGSIRALLCHLLAWPPERAFQLRVDHARVSAVRVGGTGVELLFLNADRVPVG